MNKEQFYLALEKENIVLNETQKQQFNDYYQLIYQYNQVMDLTNVYQEEEVYERHFYDSLSIAFKDDFNNCSLCDIGSGAGFPAIPLKIAFPNLKLTIIDSLNKRMNFLKKVVEQLNLTDVEIIVSRAEDVANKLKEKYDIVTARAVAKLNVLAELCVSFVKVNGRFIALKGANGEEELKQAKNALNTLNLKLEKTQNFYSDNILRINYFFIKTKSTDNKYPLPYAKIKKNPL